MPHSLSSIERSEWQSPQCVTFISTSSGSNGPGSKLNGKRGQGILHCRGVVTFGLQNLDYFAPTRTIGKGTMDKDDVLHRLRRDLLSKALESRECKPCRRRHA